MWEIKNSEGQCLKTKQHRISSLESDSLFWYSKSADTCGICSRKHSHPRPQQTLVKIKVLKTEWNKIL